jgi:hypothetical protein
MFRTDRSGENEAVTDIMPVWNPATGDLYFWRVLPEIDESAQLYRIALPDGEPQLVADLTGVFPYLSIFNPQFFYLDGAQAFSPDGETLAVVVRGNDREDFRNGIWLIDIESGQTTPLTSFSRLTAGLQGWVEEVYPTWQSYGLAWTGDGSSIATMMVDQVYALEVPIIPYVINVDTAEATPLLDFSDVEEKSEMFAIPDEGLPLIAYSPRYAVLAPDGQSMMAILSAGDQGAFAEITFDGEVNILQTSEEPLAAIFPTDYSTRSRENRVTLGGHLLTVTRD